MEGFFLTLIVHCAIISIVVALLQKRNIVQVQIKWIIISFTLFIGYFAALTFGGILIPIASYFPELEWNWSGKLASILYWIVVLAAFKACKKDFSIADAGFTLKQNQGSLRPALFVLVAFVLFQATLSYLIGDGPDRTVETLLYQGLIPGLDEEPMFRGILLYTFSLALVSSRFNFFGANMSAAGLTIVALFGLVHGILYMQGEFVFSALSLFFTSFYGLILLWLRERTGSLVLPIVAHNCVNLVGQLI